MNKLILCAGALTLAFTGAAHAKPPHAGHGKGHGAAMAGKARGGHGDLYGYGRQGCPPGLAKKNAQCMPPGLYKKQFELGQRIPYGYQGLLGYNQLPYDLRSQYGYGLDPYDRYIYQGDYLYRVDPRTMIVQQILSGLLR